MALPGMSEQTNTNSQTPTLAHTNSSSSLTTSTKPPLTSSTKPVSKKGKTTTDYLSPRGPKELIYFRDSDVLILKQSETGWWLAGKTNERKLI